jgi:hypothetical protein
MLKICNGCLQITGEHCSVFLDTKKALTYKNGECRAKRTSIEQVNALQSECRKYCGELIQNGKN